MNKTLTAVGPHIKTALPGPNAQRILEADNRLISPSYTRSYPLVAKCGHGMVIEDVDGNEFLDFSAGIAVVSTGHCHPHVVAAIQKQAAQLIHMSGTDFYYESMVELAERLTRIAPMPGPHRFYYGNSGTEAVECALKLSRYHTKRQQVIAFYGAFHGRTMGALSLTASKPQQRRRFAPLVPGVTHVPFPHLYRRPKGSDAKQYAIECARFIEEKVFTSTTPPEEVAAIFLEPIQGEGGYIVAPTEFVQELRRICDKHGIVGDVRGRGLMIGVEIVKDKEAKTPAPDLRDRIVQLAFERGILFLGAGPSSIRLSPPLVVTGEEAAVAIDVLEECVSIVERS